MAFIDWLRDQHRTSEGNRAIFGARPKGAASRVWGGYQDPQDGQRLMIRQRESFPRVPAPNPLAATVPRAEPFRPTFDPRSGVSPRQNYGPTGGSLGAFPTSPARPASPGNVPFAPQFDPRSGYCVGGMGGDMPPDGMWELIVAALMDKWGDVKEKGKKMKSGETKRKLRERIERNKIRRKRDFDYEG